jgi:hypothetical protein
VTCFDVDVTALKDGTMLIGHPDTVLEVARGRHSDTFETLAEARSEGVLEDAFPLLQDVVEGFAKFPRGRVDSNDAWISFEFKGSSLTEKNLVALDTLARKTGVQLLAFTNPNYTDEKWLATARKLNRTPGGIILAWAARDTDPFARDLDNVDAQKLRKYGIEIIFPSIRLPREFYTKVINETSIPFVTWVVDRGVDLDKAIEYGARAIISNVPHEMLSMMARRCGPT